MKYLNLFQKNRYWYLVMPIIIIYLLCMPFTAICTIENCAPSFLYLMIGWMGAFISVLNLSWLANVFIFFTIWNILQINRNWAIINGVLSFVFSALFIIHYYTIGKLLYGPGPPQEITSIGPGYYIWLASAVTALISSLFVPKKTVVIKEAEIN